MPFETGVVNAGEITAQPGAAATETSESHQDTGSAAPENGAGQAGGEQSTAEGSRVEGQPSRQRGPSKLDTIRELRGKLRERDQRYSSDVQGFKSQLEEMRSLIEQSRGGGKKPSKTFWEAPEEIMDERFQTHTKTLKEELLREIRSARETDQTTSQWRQETSEAAKFIQSQPGMTEEDIADIKEIVEDSPAMANMRPKERAEYAMYLWQRQKGISDRSSLKTKASTVVGAASQGGPKQWTKAEFEKEVSKLPPNPGDWKAEHNAAYAALEREYRQAQLQGRMK